MGFDMKEYLVKNQHDEYVLLNDVSCIPEKFVVEVPEGADIAISNGGTGIFFYNGSDLYFNDFEWRQCNADSIKTVNAFIATGATVLWQRSESPNDKLASAEQYRQAEVLPFIDDAIHKSREWDLSDYDFAESDAWIESNIEQDNVNNPSHHADSAIECIDAMQAMLTPEQFIGYLRGNILKYQWRYEKKNGIEDLKKSQWYLDKLISVL